MADLRLLGKDANAALIQMETQHMFRCTNCGEALGRGREFAKFEPVLQEGRPTIVASSFAVCARDSCKKATLEAIAWCSFYRDAEWIAGGTVPEGSLVLAEPHG
jgi:hypothetical protein